MEILSLILIHGDPIPNLNTCRSIPYPYACRSIPNLNTCTLS